MIQITYRGQPYDICSDSIEVEFEKLEKEVKRAMSNKTKEN